MRQPYLTEKSSLAISMAARKSEGGKAWVTLDCTRNSKISLVTVDLLSFSETQYSICATSFSCSILGRSSACYKKVTQFASSSFSSFSQQHLISFSIKTNKFLQHFQALLLRFFIVSFILISMRFRKTIAQTAARNFLLKILGFYFLERRGRRKGSGCAKILDIGLGFSGRVSYSSLSNLIYSSKGRLVRGVLSVISSLKSYFFLSVWGQSSSSRAFYILVLWMFRWRIWLILLSTSSILAYYYKKDPASSRRINLNPNLRKEVDRQRERWGMDNQGEIRRNGWKARKYIMVMSCNQQVQVDGQRQLGYWDGQYQHEELLNFYVKTREGKGVIAEENETAWEFGVNKGYFQAEARKKKHLHSNIDKIISNLEIIIACLCLSEKTITLILVLQHFSFLQSN